MDMKVEKQQYDVAVIMGSQSDWETMKNACDTLQMLGVSHVAKVVSAHRTPQRLYEFSESAAELGFKVIIAGAGGAAHLPGMTAALTHLPVIGVPVQSRALNGVDSLLSIAQMPKGVVVATTAIGEAGASNAGLLAAQMLAIHNPDLQQKVIEWREHNSNQIPEEVLS